jgi:hypothetical protein
MHPFIPGYVLGFISPIAILIFLGLRSDYRYHRKNGHTKLKSLRITIRRAFM